LPESAAELADRPEADNLIGIYAALAETDRDSVIRQFAGKQFSDFKPALSDLAVEKLAPVASEMRRISADPGYIDQVLSQGGARASALAEATMTDVRRIVGLLSG
jgi:tryptophanyl-tRNA synthetase